MQQQPQLAQGENKQHHIAQEGWNICSRRNVIQHSLSAAALKRYEWKSWSQRTPDKWKGSIQFPFFKIFFDSSLKDIYNNLSLFNCSEIISWTWKFLFFLPPHSSLLMLFCSYKKEGSTKRTTLPTAKPPTALEYCAKNLQNVWADFNYSFRRFAIPTTQPIVCFH